jgi:hypothetical protein
MSTYRLLSQMNTVLQNLDKILTKAQAHAEAQGIAPEDFLQARFAPDMFPFTRQIQIASDYVKGTAAKLAGKEAPNFEDTETTFAQLHERIQKTTEYFATFSPSDFDGADERQVLIAFMPGFYMTGHDYLHEMAIPNFYFHATTAYDLLRSKGVELGKRDFLGQISLKPLADG